MLFIVFFFVTARHFVALFFDKCYILLELPQRHRSTQVKLEQGLFVSDEWSCFLFQKQGSLKAEDPSPSSISATPANLTPKD